MKEFKVGDIILVNTNGLYNLIDGTEATVVDVDIYRNRYVVRFDELEDGVIVSEDGVALHAAGMRHMGLKQLYLKSYYVVSADFWEV